MDRRLVFTALEASLLLGASVLMVIGITMPFYQAYSRVYSWGHTYEFSVDIFVYEELIFLLPCAAIPGLAILAVGKVIFMKKGIAVSLRSVLPYAAILFMIPALVVIVGAQAEYIYPGVDYSRHTSIVPMQGVFLYTGGCTLLFIAQAVHLLKARGSSKMSDGITGWLARNRIDIAGATLLITFSLFSLVRYIGIPFSGQIFSLYEKVPFMYSPTPFAAGLAELFELFPPVLLLIPIGIDIALVAPARYRSWRVHGPQFPFSSAGHNMIRWIGWTIPLSALLLFLVVYRTIPPLLVTQVEWLEALSLEDIIVDIAFLWGGSAIIVLISLVTFVLLSAPILWIADLIVSQSRRVGG